MNEKIIFKSSYLNSKAYLAFFIINAFFLIDNIKNVIPGFLKSFIMGVIPIMVLFCLIGIIGGRIILTEDFLFFYYPIRPFYRKEKIQLSNIEKIEFVEGAGKAGGDFLKIYFQENTQTKKFSNPTSNKEEKLLIRKLQEKGIRAV